MPSTAQDQDFDPMKARELSSRWTLSATLKLQSAAHFGGHSDSVLDMPILRCASTQKPLLLGTSLAGALRSHALDRRLGYSVAEDSLAGAGKGSTASPRPSAEVADLFGAGRGDDSGSQSPLIVFDALGSEAKTEVRDGVMIDSKTGTAEEHKKFDFEVLPPGVEFDLRFDLLVPASADESRLLTLLCSSLEGLSQGEIRLGMRRSRGLGEIACWGWNAKRFDLRQRAGWLEWVRSSHEDPIPSGANAFDSPWEAIESAGARLDRATRDQRCRSVVEVEASIRGELLIRSPGLDAGGPDVAHLTSGGGPVLSGTSLAGVVRSQALRIVRLMHGSECPHAEKTWIDPLFGTRLEGDRDPRFRPTASRLQISESPIRNGGSRLATRIAIDRFTQGTIPQALFEEKPQCGGEVRLRFEIRNPKRGETGLLLLVLKDLLTGRLAVGGASSVGRGTLAGRNLRVSGTKHSGIREAVSLDFRGEDAASGRVPASSELDRLIAEFVRPKRSQAEPEPQEARR